jgi:predicted methyltransferase
MFTLECRHQHCQLGLTFRFPQGAVARSPNTNRPRGEVPFASYRPSPDQGATPAGFNQAVYERLKPGGIYVIVDHVAAAGTGTSHAESLHRIGPAAVREEVETAGFVLDAESTVLANKDDPHSIKVFDPSIKGETDRFAYRFVRL